MCKADSHQIGLWRSQQQLIHTCQGLCGDRLLKDGHLIGSGKSIVQEMMIVIPILILVNQEPFVCWKESFAKKIWISGQNLRSVPVFFFPSSRPCETPSAANCIHRWSARHHPLPRFVEDAAPVMTQMESSQFLGIVAGGQSRLCFPQRGGYLYWLADFNCQIWNFEEKQMSIQCCLDPSGGCLYLNYNRSMCGN